MKYLLLVLVLLLSSCSASQNALGMLVKPVDIEQVEDEIITACWSNDGEIECLHFDMMVWNLNNSEPAKEGMQALLYDCLDMTDNCGIFKFAETVPALLKR